jgi:esterase/lipase superfamily enzyme
MVMRWHMSQTRKPTKVPFRLSGISWCRCTTGCEAKRIHIIAHSMGNRALVQALSQIAREHLGGDGPLFQNVILAAPDVDRRVFEELASAFRSEAVRVTLYASDSDKALAAAQTLQRFPRAGDANPLLVVSGIDNDRTRASSTQTSGTTATSPTRDC